MRIIEASNRSCGEALFVDEKLADSVWEAWAKGEIDDLTA